MLDGSAEVFLAEVWQPSVRWWDQLGGKVKLPPRSVNSDVLMFAIAGQESGRKWRWQQEFGGGFGPAHGLWQFEHAGGVRGVLTNLTTRGYAKLICGDLRVPFGELNIWNQMMQPPTGDLLSWAFARLLLWSDPAPLPDVDDPDEGWDYYNRNWRPGSPHRAAWENNWNIAAAAVGGKA